MYEGRHGISVTQVPMPPVFAALVREEARPFQERLSSLQKQRDELVLSHSREEESADAIYERKAFPLELLKEKWKRKGRFEVIECFDKNGRKYLETLIVFRWEDRKSTWEERLNPEGQREKRRKEKRY
ncbi:hypothetical protein B488_08920 [Liberibacter crescens BT-1]|uniref:Uncharacterized protein n=2 Tax=Liberibacter crescens TaxID=1273132 RepID=L0ETL4_LIBCB|nr:hypothetical protein B488_08920 [Liberibacter crescens BT-1]AMC12920.1 hypothetical protein RL73_04505 [Liberibacter crescens]